MLFNSSSLYRVQSLDPYKQIEGGCRNVARSFKGLRACFGAEVVLRPYKEHSIDHTNAWFHSDDGSLGEGDRVVF